MVEGILIALGILAGFYKFRKLRAEALEQECQLPPIKIGGL